MGDGGSSWSVTERDPAQSTQPCPFPPQNLQVGGPEAGRRTVQSVLLSLSLGLRLGSLLGGEVIETDPPWALAGSSLWAYGDLGCGLRSSSHVGLLRSDLISGNMLGVMKGGELR